MNQQARRFPDLGTAIDSAGVNSAAGVIAAASDIALIVSEDGIVEDVAVNDVEAFDRFPQAWRGRPWEDTVTVESRDKIHDLIAEANSAAAARWRQVNHERKSGDDMPVRYSAIRVGGRIIAFGRELRNEARLQQRLINAQIEMEREFERLRDTELRYRVLFQASSEAVVVVDESTLQIADANAAAERVVGLARGRLTGLRLADVFSITGTRSIRAVINEALAAAASADVELTVSSNSRPLTAALSRVRRDKANALLLHLVADKTDDDELTGRHSPLLEVLWNLPEGFVVTDADFSVLEANQRFLAMTEASGVEALRGQPLERWFDPANVDFRVLVANLKQHGSVQRFSSRIFSRYGASQDVEIAAVAAPADDQTVYGFSIRPAKPRTGALPIVDGLMPESSARLTELIGHMSLKEVVRETTDVIERLCIEAALQLTSDNRASAAQMLGLSRQGFYAKLRRHGLGDLPSDEGEPPRKN